MTPRTAYRYVPRTIRHTSEAGATFEAHCPPDRNAHSGLLATQEAARERAPRHTGRASHTRFRQVMTDHARVSRDE
ncbi:hypothetical protein [Streptomyces sp. NPDC058683]|uniref:DUF7848 domain-containing protein n=1 Tax=Streptomyces sp. NPDC058683 TaxID=3346597 RepID=UPI003651DFBF